MKIGELAKHTGLSTHTLRYYEKAGLLAASGRSDGNYRLYSTDDLATAKFIKQSKEAGFSLADTQQFLSIRADKPAHVCAQAKQLAEQKIVQVNNKINELQQILSALHKLSDACCGGNESAEFCSIIEALDGQKTSASIHKEQAVDNFGISAEEK